jgi:hypothetical protein
MVLLETLVEVVVEEEMVQVVEVLVDQETLQAHLQVKEIMEAVVDLIQIVVVLVEQGVVVDLAKQAVIIQVQGVEQVVMVQLLL